MKVWKKKEKKRLPRAVLAAPDQGASILNPSLLLFQLPPWASGTSCYFSYKICHFRLLFVKEFVLIKSS